MTEREINEIAAKCAKYWALSIEDCVSPNTKIRLYSECKSMLEILTQYYQIIPLNNSPLYSIDREVLEEAYRSVKELSNTDNKEMSAYYRGAAETMEYLLGYPSSKI
ncbi:MAG: hypothetical protein NC453_21715 [Muribaculum sp.]|nr:hypothetical protein [Muribaculum sp.]